MSIIRNEDCPSRVVPAEDVAIIFKGDGTVDIMIPVCTDDDVVPLQGMVAGALYVLMQENSTQLAQVVASKMKVMQEKLKMMEMMDMQDLPSINGGGKCPTN